MVEDRPTDSALQWTVETHNSSGVSLCLANFAHPQTREETTFAVVADPHVTPTGRGTWKVYHRTAQRFRAAITDINQRNVEAVLFAGDVTKDGTIDEFRHINELVRELQVPFLAIPGNHDVPKPALDGHTTPPIESFIQQYAGGQLPFVETVGGIDLVGLNTATVPDGSLADTHGGRISDSQLEWLADMLPSLDCPVVAMHHNLIRRGDEETPSETDICQLDNYSEVATILSDGGVELVLAGHTHCPAVGVLSGVREVIVPATCSFPQAYALVHIGPEGTEVELVPLADQAGLREAWTLAIEDGREQLLTAATDQYPIVDERSPRHDAAGKSTRFPAATTE